MKTKFELRDVPSLVNAMEWGFKASEKGWNLEEAREEFEKVLNE